MAQTDWAVMEDSIDGTDMEGITVKRGPSHGYPSPVGGNDFVFAMNSIQSVAGAVALYCTIEGYSPILPRVATESGGGGYVSAAIKKGASGGKTNYSPFIFIGAQGNSVNDDGYLLGLENAVPHRIVLAKGKIVNGIPSISEESDTTILRYSQDAFDDNVWHQLRLDMVVNDNDDVVLWAFKSDIAESVGAGDVTDPVWEPIQFNDALEFPDGVFVDDRNEINSGSAPLLFGYVGFGAMIRDSTRRVYFDALEVIRQLAPTVYAGKKWQKKQYLK